jgi:hypothetical protein
MTFQQYYRRLSSEERDNYAESIGISRAYIEIHLMKTQRRNPSTTTMQRMATHSHGHLNYMDVIKSFPPLNQSEAAAS